MAEREATGKLRTTDLLLDRPELAFRWAGMEADPWQLDFVGSEERQLLLLCSRQCGKTQAAITKVLRTALLQDSCLILLLAPSDRQSKEFLDRLKAAYRRMGEPQAVVRENEHALQLANGSRILALPENERTIRVYSGVALLVIDEASRVSDELYFAVRPMLAVSHGQLLALSTPFGQRGWFYNAWEQGADWQRTRVTAEQCPRFTREFLENERRSMPERQYLQEYECVFSEIEGAVFRQEDIDAVFETERIGFMVE